ncbi:uncharacterized protein KY384_006263 [Bacidia gigantensis]|uniref:uncharacterized protein n=1 Tax=Bacidia gigantensis TaxID=2732470 RepID=UPI001D052CAB|nr:uncharacterized protein KY384_006263 [Bacidia gigantensis]KAG8528576.1 hypothetical protein KY384_006263 [Bacidia gigantensis]
MMIPSILLQRRRRKDAIIRQIVRITRRIRISPRRTRPGTHISHCLHARINNIENSHNIRAKTLQPFLLPRHHPLTRRTALVKRIIQRDANTNPIADMGDGIRGLHPQAGGRIHDIMNEIVHIGRGQIHKPMHYGLRTASPISWHAPVRAAEEVAEVRVEGNEEMVLIAMFIKRGDILAKRGLAAAIEEIQRHGPTVPICGKERAVEVLEQIDIVDVVAGPAVAGVRVEEARALVGAVWVLGPFGADDGGVVAHEGHVDYARDPVELGGVFGGVFLAEGRVGGDEAAGGVGGEREVDVPGQGELAACVLGC